MNRRDSLIGFMALVAVPPALPARPSSRVARIGFLSFSRGGDSHGGEGFAQIPRSLLPSAHAWFE